MSDTATLEELLRAALLADDGVSGLLGNSLYLVSLPQNPTYPAAVYQRISTVPLYTINQPAEWGTFGWARFQFTIWCQGPSSGAQTDQIARAIQAAMCSFNGSVLPGSPPTIIQAPNFLLNRRMSVEPQTQPPLYKAILDYRIAFQEQ